MKSIYVVLPTASSISTEFAAIKARYDEQQAKHNAHEYMYPVRKIICKGCGKTFYTIVKSKKYCDYYTCGKLGNWKRQRQKRLAQRTGLVCRCCGKTFTPNAKMLSIVVMPAVRNPTARALRINHAIKKDTW